MGEKIKISDTSTTTIDSISKIYLDSSNAEEEKEEMYICPHCKNILIIPRKQEP